VPVLGDAAPKDNVFHVLGSERNGSRHTIYRVYQAVSELLQSLKHLRRLCDELPVARRISTLVESREYGLAVLAPTASYLAEIRLAVADERLDRDIAMVTDLGPTAETFGSVIKGRER
jgi:hypothetical protein